MPDNKRVRQNTNTDHLVHCKSQEFLDSISLDDFKYHQYPVQAVDGEGKQSKMDYHK